MENANSVFDQKNCTHCHNSKIKDHRMYLLDIT